MPPVPSAMLQAFEQFYLEITQPLDPYIALTLTNLSKQAIATAYLMGFQDAQKNLNSPLDKTNKISHNNLCRVEVSKYGKVDIF